MTLWTDRVRPRTLDRLADEVAPVDGPGAGAAAATGAGTPKTTDERTSLTVEAPFTGEDIGSLPAADVADVDDAVNRARDAQREWASLPLDRRTDVLSRFHDLVLDDREELLDLVAIESGKVRRDAFEEIHEPNFHKLMIHTKNDIWPSFKALLSREQAPQSA